MTVHFVELNESMVASQKKEGLEVWLQLIKKPQLTNSIQAHM